MADYPRAGDSTGIVYDVQRRLPFSAYNNARAAGALTVALATSTTVSNVDIRSGDVVLLFPANLKATRMQGGTDAASGIYVSSVVDGSFVVTHDLDADAEGSIFNYAIFRNF